MEKTPSYIYSHNSEAKINSSSKEVLQEPMLWTSSSHHLLPQNALGRGEQSVTPAVFLARDSSTPRVDLQKEGLHFSCLRQPCRDQADTAHAKGREQPSPVATGLLQPHQHFPPNSSAPLSFHKTRRHFKSLKETWSKDLQISITVSLFLHLCLKVNSKLHLYAFFPNHSLLMFVV